MKNMRKITNFLRTAFLCSVFVLVRAAAHGLTVEPNPALHSVLGSLYSISAAAGLYQGEVGVRPPAVERLAGYFQKDKLPQGWDWKTSMLIEIRGTGWLIGVKVPPAQEARKFLRINAKLLGVFEKDVNTPWLGGQYAWMRSSELSQVKVREGYGDDSSYLFFNSPGTDYFWRSSLLMTPSAGKEVLKRHGQEFAGVSDPALMVKATQPGKEVFKANPVTLPEDFTISSDEDGDTGPSIGGVKINPVPKMR